MAYRRTTRRRFRRATTTKKKVRVSTARVRRIVHNMEEKKFLDKTIASGVMSSGAWDVDDHVASLQQGTSASQRIGNKIMVHKIEWCITMVPLVTMPAAGCVSRFAIVHNKETVGTTITGTDVFLSATFDTLKNTANQPRYTVLRDQNHSMVVTGMNGATQAAVGPIASIKLTIFPKKIVSFNGNTGGNGDLLKDNWSLLSICSNPNACNMQGTWKMTFSDA